MGQSVMNNAASAILGIITVIVGVKIMTTRDLLDWKRWLPVAMISIVSVGVGTSAATLFNISRGLVPADDVFHWNIRIGLFSGWLIGMAVIVLFVAWRQRRDA